MANRAYLVGSNERCTAGPSIDGGGYDPNAEILAGASRLIPVLWLSLFAEEDVTHHVFDDHRIPTIVAPAINARRRFQSRVALLHDKFPRNAEQIAAFEELIDGASFDFIKIDAGEIWSFDPDSFESQLSGAVRWFSSLADDDFQDLLDISETVYHALTQQLIGEGSPKHNFHGYAWVREVPWDDGEQDDCETVGVGQQEVQFGAFAQRAVEKHPLLTKLANLDYFAHAGEAVDSPWATSKGSDLTDAYLTYAHNSDWGFIKLAAWHCVMEWVKNNVQSDAETYYRDKKGEIDTACEEIFYAKIRPRLPSKLRKYQVPFDRYFTWDLMHMTIEYELVAQGMPGGLCSFLLTTYEAGCFPCGWEGDFPDGKAIVH